MALPAADPPSLLDQLPCEIVLASGDIAFVQSICNPATNVETIKITANNTVVHVSVPRGSNPHGNLGLVNRGLLTLESVFGSAIRPAVLASRFSAGSSEVAAELPH